MSCLLDSRCCCIFSAVFIGILHYNFTKAFFFEHTPVAVINSNPSVNYLVATRLAICCKARYRSEDTDSRSVDVPCCSTPSDQTHIKYRSTKLLSVSCNPFRQFTHDGSMRHNTNENVLFPDQCAFNKYLPQEPQG